MHPVTSQAMGQYNKINGTRAVNQHKMLRYLLNLAAHPQALLGGKESLVTTACAYANPYQQNIVSCFSHTVID